MSPSDSAANSADDKQRLARLLSETSFRVESEATIRLASGRMSRYYVDCKRLLSYAEARELIGRLMLAMLGDSIDSIDGVGGMELGAYPVGIAVSDAIYRERGLSIPVFVVRKQVKEHGTKKAIEGVAKPGDRVLMVEDVVTTGGSTAQAIERCKEAGLEVVRAIAVLDRMEGRDEPVDVGGMKLESLLTLNDLLAVRD